MVGRRPPSDWDPWHDLAATILVFPVLLVACTACGIFYGAEWLARFIVEHGE